MRELGSYLDDANVRAEVNSSNDLDELICGGMSFSPQTRILLANGKTVPISALTIGTKILAWDTRTHHNKVEAVSAVLVHYDQNLYDIRLEVGHQTAVVETTRNHPFYQATGRWIWASELATGTRLRTSDASTVTVTGGYAPVRTDGWMWDLTVPAEHDFFVSAGAATVLVHNDSCSPGLRSIGHNPAYIDLANATGAKYFSIPIDVWNSMSPDEQWEANQKFLDRGIDQGDTFLLATPLTQMRAGSGYETEVNYLLGNGYILNTTGNALVPRS
jgi:hypothetical protein